MKNVKVLALEIYIISGQVDTLNKTFKLSFAICNNVVVY